jgi:hypothetical protein
MVSKLTSPISAVLERVSDIISTQTAERELEAARLIGPLFVKVIPLAHKEAGITILKVTA